MTIIYWPAHATPSLHQDLMALTKSIRQAEQRTQQINEKLSDLQNQAEDLESQIATLEYKTTKQLQQLASIQKNNGALSYLSPHQNFLNHHYNHRTQQSLKNILSMRLQTHKKTLAELEITQNNIETYLDNREAIQQDLANLREKISYNSKNTNNEIKLKIIGLKDKSNNLDTFLMDILELDSIAAINPNRPLEFTLPLSGTLKNNDNILSITAAPNALVTAPENAVVAYADSYKNLGNIVILNHGQGYISILRGLKRLYIQTGLTIQKGEPLGILDGDGRKKDGKDAMLYYQLRYNNLTINPIQKLTGL